MTSQEQIAPEKSIKTNISKVQEWRNHNKYTFNLVALILFLILLPLFSENVASQYLVYILIILVLISAIFTISGNRLYLIIGSFFAVVSIILNVLYYLTGEPPFYQA
jgi:predicted neutral ceramidase superfamily lipid hydrolase